MVYHDLVAGRAIVLLLLMVCFQCSCDQTNSAEKNDVSTIEMQSEDVNSSALQAVEKLVLEFFNRAETIFLYPIAEDGSVGNGRPLLDDNIPNLELSCDLAERIVNEGDVAVKAVRPYLTDDRVVYVFRNARQGESAVSFERTTIGQIAWCLIDAIVRKDAGCDSYFPANYISVLMISDDEMRKDYAAKLDQWIDAYLSAGGSGSRRPIPTFPSLPNTERSNSGNR